MRALFYFRVDTVIVQLPHSYRTITVPLLYTYREPIVNLSYRSQTQLGGNSATTICIRLLNSAEL